MLVTAALLGCLLFVCAPAFAAATEGTAKIEFSTLTTDGKHAPKHVLAVWITDVKTNFVASVLKQASKRQKYLVAWNLARGDNNQVDGVTGATLRDHAPRSATWNGRDAAGNPAPDGSYFFFIEFAEAHSPGPKAVVPFNKGPLAQEQTVSDLKNFTNVKVTFTPTAAGHGK